MKKKSLASIDEIIKDAKNGKIFIQIASYRDPELINTLDDCIDKADKPENLVFGICWQHSTEDAWDSLEQYQNDPRFRILDVNYKEAQGACWARNQIQQLYKGEDYTLQLDSHHRFIENWDQEIIDMLEGLRSRYVYSGNNRIDSKGIKLDRIVKHHLIKKET